MRTIFGQTTCQRPSRFIDEIDSKHLKNETKSPKAAVSSHISGIGRKITSFKPVTIDTPPAADNQDFSRGDIVYHAKFGRGFVVNAKKYGKDTLVEVNFDSVGTKQLMANFAKLKKEE